LNEITNVEQLTFIVSSAVSVFFAVMACAGLSSKRTICFLWLCGLGVGGIFLSLGAEFLALVQWMTATLLLMVMSYLSMLLKDGETQTKRMKRTRVFVTLGGVVTVAVIASIDVGTLSAFGPNTELEKGGIMSVAQLLVGKYAVTFGVFCVLVFVSIVGIGTNFRPMERNK